MAKFFKFVLLIIMIPVLILVGFRANAWLQESKTATQIKTSNGRFVETEAGTMHVSVWGEESDTPVLATHGMAAWGGLWEETAKELAANGYLVIAVDQPPFGFSERGDGDFSRTAQAKRLAALAKAMQLENYMLLGHSYGGGVAMETALRSPENIAGLVLVCPVMVLAKDDSELVAKTVPLPLRINPLAETLVSATITNPLLTEFLTKRFMHRKQSLTQRHIKILQKPMVLKGNTKNMVIWLQQFLAGDPNAISRMRSELAKNKIPLSLIWGEEDQVTPIHQGEELTQIMNPLSFERMQNIGHMPQLEAPKQFNALLLKTLSFLKSNESLNWEFRQ